MNNQRNLFDALAVLLVLNTVHGGSIVLAVALLVRTGGNCSFHCKNKFSVSLCCSCKFLNCAAICTHSTTNCQNIHSWLSTAVATVGVYAIYDRVANVKNQPPNFKQLVPCAWRAHWCLNNRTLKLHSQAYIASELHWNCFMWLRG